MPISGPRWHIPRAAIRRQDFGFTLLEILIVGALIALFASIALVSYQRFYDDSKRKTIFDEVKQVGTAAGLAEQDVAFIPRLHLLSLPKALVTARANANSQATTIVRPAMDAYGFLPENSPLTAAIVEKWTGNYLGSSDARVRLSAGNSGLTTMRLPEQPVFGGSWNHIKPDISLANWPIDAWGNPYTIYLVVSDTRLQGRANNPLGLRLIGRPTEFADFMTAIVSYGPNHVPGGTSEDYTFNQNIAQADRDRAKAWINTMKSARMYIVNNKSDEPVPLNDPGAAFTLRSATSSIAQATFDTQFGSLFANSVTNASAPGDLAQPGIKDTGSDDIIWPF